MPELDLGLSPTVEITEKQLPEARRETAATAKEVDTVPRKIAPCHCKRPHRRNLVVCIDGTANKFSRKNSNVVELFSNLEKSNEQLTYYNSGIGTYVPESSFSPGEATHHALDMAFAKNLKQKVLRAYQWLSENYEEGDRIYLFGFSRGAYQVRVIAGMIEKVGLLHKGNNEQIPFAYDLYTKTTKTEKRGDKNEPHDLCQRFKQTLSRLDVRVHFVGAWDTVSSVGILRGTSLPETNTGMKHVCIFRHALALDERRVKFLPEYANGGDGPDVNQRAEKVKEVWFAGSHSDIGGGKTPNLELDHFGPSLRWMSYEAICYGLKMKTNRSRWCRMAPTESMSHKWRILEYLPMPRLTYRDPKPNSVVWRPHRCRPRKMRPGQLIHESVFEEINLDRPYKPKARLCNGTNWDKDEMQALELVEKDPYADASHVIRKLENYQIDNRLTNADIHVLENLTSTDIGARSITEFPDAANLLIRALRFEIKNLESWKPDPEKFLLSRKIISVLVAALNVFKLSPTYNVRYSLANLKKLRPVLSDYFPEAQDTWANLEGFSRLYKELVILVMGVTGSKKDSVSIYVHGGKRKLIKPVAYYMILSIVIQFFERIQHSNTQPGVDSGDARIAFVDNPPENLQGYTSLRGHRLIVLNTPDVGDTVKQDADTLLTVAKWLSKCREGKATLAGFIFFQNNSSSEFAGTAGHYRQTFQEMHAVLSAVERLLGSWENIMIVGDEKERDSDSDLRHSLIDAGAKIRNFNPLSREGEDSAWGLVDTLLQRGPARLNEAQMNFAAISGPLMSLFSQKSSTRRSNVEYLRRLVIPGR